MGPRALFQRAQALCPLSLGQEPMCPSVSAVQAASSGRLVSFY